MRRLLVIAMLVSMSAPALAVKPDEMLKDAALEARARDISAGLRCLVCQNQSIDDSDAELARDLRLLVRERLTAGDSDAQAVDYIVARYGDFVLLKPRFGPATWALWLGPFAILGLAGAYLLMRRRPSVNPAEAKLTEAEEEELKRVTSLPP